MAGGAALRRTSSTARVCTPHNQGSPHSLVDLRVGLKRSADLLDNSNPILGLEDAHRIHARTRGENRELASALAQAVTSDPIMLPLRTACERRIGTLSTCSYPRVQVHVPTLAGPARANVVALPLGICTFRFAA
jgi:hypothetical protein